MTELGIPEDVQDFLGGHVKSHEQLHIVSWLSDRHQLAHSADQVASALGIPQIVAKEALLALCRQRLVKLVGSEGSLRFQFGPATPELATAVARLLSAYVENPTGLIKVLIHMAIERLRRDAGALFLEEIARRR